MERQLFIAALLAATVSGLCHAQDLQKFDKSIGISDSELRTIEAQEPSILQNAPRSSAAESSISVSRMRINPRIVGGKPMPDIAEHPWQAALIFAAGPDPVRMQFCGGSLIRPNWILTAAHCVDKGTKPETVDVVLGTAFYQHFGERLKVKQVIVHEEWDSDTMENDVAVLELASIASQGKVIELVAAGASIAPDTNRRVTGWGALSEGGRGSEILMGADIPLVDNDTCNARPSYGGAIKSGMICAGKQEGGLDSCQGDSGGPAVVSSTANKKLLAGIVSWGTGCAREDKYGVYTNVAAYRGWIDGKIKP